MSNTSLFRKILESASESEAIACLKMARKKGVTFDSLNSSDSTKGNGSREYQELKRAYDETCYMYQRMKNTLSTQEKKLVKLQVKMQKDEFNFWWYITITSLGTSLIVWALTYSPPASCFLF